MTIDEAIQHCEEEAVEQDHDAEIAERCKDYEIAVACRECAEDHRQLAEWLRELKEYREREV